MFLNLKKSRSLIMGLAILWVAFYHIPWVDRGNVTDFIHDIGYIGVDVFLFISGIGACHSIRQRGGRGYLVQRAKRILPGLFPFLLVWSLALLALGILSIKQFLGSVTLLGWWLGSDMQLNWYFSAVWMYFLLAVLLYRPVVQGKHPLVFVLLVSLLGFAAMRLTPFWHHPTAYSRIPIFFVGMLLGRAELQGNCNEKRLRIILYSLLPVGLILTVMTWHSWGSLYGNALGLWWYPFVLVVPGGVFLTADLACAIGKWKAAELVMKPFEALGEASSEALMIHVGVYKIIQIYTKLYVKQWILVLLLCMAAAVLYRAAAKKLPVIIKRTH